MSGGNRVADLIKRVLGKNVSLEDALRVIADLNPEALDGALLGTDPLNAKIDAVNNNQEYFYEFRENTKHFEIRPSKTSGPWQFSWTENGTDNDGGVSMGSQCAYREILIRLPANKRRIYFKHSKNGAKFDIIEWT